MKRRILYLIVSIAVIVVASSLFYFFVLGAGEPNITITNISCNTNSGQVLNSFTLTNSGGYGYAKVSLVEKYTNGTIQSYLANKTYYVPSKSQIKEEIAYNNSCYYPYAGNVTLIGEYK